MRRSRRSRPDPPLFFIRVVVEEPFELEFRRLLSRMYRYALVFEEHYYRNFDQYKRPSLKRVEIIALIDHEGLRKFRKSLGHMHLKDFFIGVEKQAVL